MTSKILALIILVIIVILGSAFLMNQKTTQDITSPDTRYAATPTSSGDDTSSSTERTVQGTIISINTEKMMIDGPGLITIKTDDGSQAVIAVPARINLCPAQDYIANIYDLKSGLKVTARGEIEPDGSIVPCRSATHYLKVMGQ